MKWIRASLTAKVSECGRYAIARVTTNGLPSYELWVEKKFVSRHASGAEATAAAKELMAEKAAA